MSKNVGKALNKESDFCCLLADTVIKSETVRGGLYATSTRYL